MAGYLVRLTKKGKLMDARWAGMMVEMLANQKQKDALMAEY